MKANGVVYKHKDNKIAVETDSSNWNKGDFVSIVVGQPRNVRQNALYWTFLDWAISKGGGDLISQGCLSPVDLHEDLKLWQGMETTTNLTKNEFSQYYENCKDCLVSQFGVNVTVFEKINET